MINKATQNLLISSGKFEHEKTFWTNNLTGDIVMGNVPPDFKNSAVHDCKQLSETVKLSPNMLKKLDSMSNGSEHVKYIILLSGIIYLISKYTGQNNIVIGLPDFKKNLQKKNIILPLRIFINKDTTFKQMLIELKQKVTDTNQNANLPYPMILDLLGIKNSVIGTMPFNTIVCSNSIHNESFINESPPDTLFTFVSNTDSTEIKLTYDSSIFKCETIQTVLNHLINFYEIAFTSPDIKLKNIDILSKYEKKQILFDFNNTRASYPKHQTLHGLFEEQVLKTPQNTALVYKDKKITYEKLNQKINMLANTLRNKGIQPNDIVGITAERSIEMIVGIYAIIKSGGAYLPISPDYPQERVEYMVKDSQMKIMLAQNRFIENFNLECEIIDIDNPDCYTKNGLNPANTNKPTDTAYVIYTSGSTRMPKGTMIAHYSAINRIIWMQEKYPLHFNDVILQKTPYTFDVSVWEIFWWGMTGASVCMLPQGDEKNPPELVNTIYRYNVTIMHFVPSMLNSFLTYVEANLNNVEKLETLTQVFAGGEALSVQQVNTFNNLLNSTNSTKLSNLYGPTEVAIDVSYFDCSDNKEPLNLIPIGKPIHNINLYILDQYDNLQSVGLVGEICIAGDGVGKGYINNPELTNSKFIPDPFIAGRKMYRTGDIGKWLPDGNIAFVGRKDHLVKVRGFRIELGEIESALLAHSSVKDTAVIDLKNSDSSKYLCAYIVSDEAIDVNIMRAYLLRMLPDYMIPSYFIQIDEIPLTANGKLNRNALPQPHSKMITDKYFKEPTNHTQTILVKVFEEILGLENIGINNNFFILGGDSIKALHVSAQLQKYGMSLLVKDLLSNPVIENLSTYVKIESKNPSTSENSKSFDSDLLESERSFITLYVKNPIQSIYKLSPMQEDMLFHSLSNETSNAYFEQAVITLNGNLNVEMLERSFNAVIAKYDILRTNFIYENLSKPRQVVLESKKANINFFDIASNENKDNFINKFIQSDVDTGFDLSRDILMRISVIKTDLTEYKLVWSFHHILLDGWSTNVLFRDIIEFYDAFLKNKPIQVKTAPSYINYIKWLEKQDVNASYEYWTNYLSEYEQTSVIPKLATLQNKDNGKCDTWFTLDKTASEGIVKLASSNNVTVNTLFKTVWGLLLQKYNNTNDVIFGTVISDRSPEIENSQEMVGLFINTVPVRINCEKTVLFKTLLENTQKNAVESGIHEYLQLAEIQSKSLLKNTLFDHILVFENYPISKEIDALERENKIDLRITDVQMSAETNYDLVIVIVPGETFDIKINYNSQIYSENIINNIKNHFLRIVEQIVKTPDIAVNRIDILSNDEKQKLITTFNSEVIDYPKEKTIHQLFEEQAMRTPNNIAVSFENTSLTYKELNERAEIIAIAIKSKCTNCNVALMSEHSVTMIAAVMGILKADCTYLPIDPKYPKSRIEYILKDSQTPLVLTYDRFKNHISTDAEIITLDCIETNMLENTHTCILSNFNTPAYLIYTSGSSGVPKGITVTHKALNNFVHSLADKFDQQFTSDDNCLSLTNICFDVSIAEIFLPLVFGSTLVLFGSSGILDAEDIANTILEKSITFAYIPPTILTDVFEFLRDLDEKILLDKMLVGVEPIKDLVLENYISLNFDMTIINGYGPTEATICATLYKYLPYTASGKNVPIGMPLANNKVYLLDSDQNPVPIGVPGELCISGDGLSKGYFRNKELTDKKFVQNPFSQDEKMYKTGDLAYRLDNGNIMFLGMIDRQVKIRGYRVELGEIESTLLKHNDVKEVFVTDLSDSNSVKYLCAYIVSSEPVPIEQLRNVVKNSLPDYMMPAHFVHVQKLPVTANGKIDKKALPLPEQSISSNEYTAPRSPNEKLLASIWESILGMERVSMFDNFFNIGGDSIKSTQMVSMLRKHGLSLKVNDVFHYQDIASLSMQIKTVAGKTDQTKCER